MARRSKFDGPLRVTVKAYLADPSGKPDWDNIAKNLDALTGIVWYDDTQIVDGRVLKMIVSDEPKLVVEVEKL